MLLTGLFTAAVAVILFWVGEIAEMDAMDSEGPVKKKPTVIELEPAVKTATCNKCGETHQFLPPAVPPTLTIPFGSETVFQFKYCPGCVAKFVKENIGELIEDGAATRQ